MYLLPQSLFSPLLSFLAEKGRALIILPYGNVGDELILRSMSHLFDKEGVSYTTIHAKKAETVSSCEWDDFDVLCWGGGGNVSGRYGTTPLIVKASQEAKRRGKPFVCFPQSIEKFSSHLLHFDRLYLRDVNSVAMCINHGHSNVVLVPDFAFAHPTTIHTQATENEEAWFFRSDSESARLGHPIHDPRQEGFAKFFEYARSAETIHTDLLHFSIASLLQGKRVKLYPGNWHKNHSMFATWLHHCNCEFCLA